MQVLWRARCARVCGLACITAALSGFAAHADRIAVSPSGHFVTYRGETRMLIGESGTQCVTQNANLDYRAWLDDCHARGIPMVHVWAFVAPRQKQDGSVVEDRWGYVYPGLTPWARQAGGPPAEDQLPQWDLRRFDEGEDETHYWPRMRGLCAYARDRGMLVGITLFTGWAKHEADWLYHPLNVRNGGHLTDVRGAVRIESPGTEVWETPWSSDWPDARKTQWVWERLAMKFVDELNGFGNVFFVFFDEHSYSDGNMGGHFAAFFRSRGALWVDRVERRDSVDFTMSPTVGRDDKNALAVGGFSGEPPRPYLLLEGGPYAGEGVRTGLWTFAMGGGHFTFHADERQETVATGIMGYDPHVPGGGKGMDKRDWLGHASRFFNEHIQHLDAMAPANALTDGTAYCLAAPGREYAVYALPEGSAGVAIDLAAAAGTSCTARFYNPRTGHFLEAFALAGGESHRVPKPGAGDWVLHVTVP